MSKRLKLSGERVLVRPTPRDEKTDAGIFLPDAAADPPPTGVIIETAPNIEQAYGFAVGDEVMYEHFAGHEITLNGEKLRVLDVASIMGVLVDEPVPSES